MKKTLTTGFTIVETLVAITILMIAIAGPLTVANKGYTASLDARNEAIASNLAQEGLEELSNLKDNGSWPPGSSKCQIVGSPTSPNSACGVELSATGVPATGSCALLNACQLSLNSSNEYVYNGTATTPFTRYFYLNATPDNAQELATVVVSWTTGTVNNQVQFQEVLTNSTR